ncbi:GNAT family N-acetyltransferase [Desulfosporosinus fructosivorans]
MRTSEFTISKGEITDLPMIVGLYNELHDALENGINYPLWKKHVYPNAETAIEGITTETLYIIKDRDCIVGTIILNHCQYEAYGKLKWTVNAENNEIIVIHTLAVHPNYFGLGVARILMKFGEDLAFAKGMKAIRLDVSVNNLPAIKLYEKCGYTLVGEVDLGLNIIGLELFKCYEKAILKCQNSG